MCVTLGQGGGQGGRSARSEDCTTPPPPPVPGVVGASVSMRLEELQRPQHAACA